MDDFADAWAIRSDTIYLNHGSFGPAPRPVRAAHAGWRAAMEQQPMDFFVRQLEPAWLAARDSMADFVGASPESVALVDNSTHAMNIVAHSFPLTEGDEIVLTDHEYGAVLRTWERVCTERGAGIQIATIPWPLHDASEIVDSILSCVTERTRMIVASHITSPTALVLPVAELTHAAHARGIAVCIDGPHAIAQVPLDLDKLGCDFYTASCHKWLCAPFGSGFLYAQPKWQPALRPLLTSWGRVPPREPHAWWEYFIWRGTRDVTALLSIPAAIDFLTNEVGVEEFRESTHALAQFARSKLLELVGTTPWTEDSPQWYGSMVNVPLPDGDAAALQRALWERHGIEIPVISFLGERSIRVSCHLYNTEHHIASLIDALKEELSREPAPTWRGVSM